VGLRGWSARGGQSRVGARHHLLSRAASCLASSKLVVTPTTHCAADADKFTGPLRALGESVRLEHGLVDSGSGEYGGSDIGD
jgi:hypothetical protein